MEAAIIGVLGAGLLGLIGIFLQAIRSDVRAVGTRLGRSETILGEVRERLAGIEATQAEHGRLLTDHGRQLTNHGRLLADHGRQLTEHGRLLADHGRQLTDHGRLLTEIDGPRRADRRT